MRVVSFVPSWTETLIVAGIEVVARTRFCIHPENAVKAIPVVGGTKNINSIDQIVDLKPDYVLFDKEENNLEMYQLCLEHKLKCISTHVVDIDSCGEELIKLGTIFENPQLIAWGQDYIGLQNQPFEAFQKCVIDGEFSFESVGEVTVFHYVIWKNPFMRVSDQTFIASVLKLFGIDLVCSDKKYPEISEAELKKAFCIFSSEPYPFAKYFAELKDQGYKGVLADGEKISWYGVRTLKFLQSLQPF